MIIGISGYIGSGKDTVGEMIQYLSSKETASYFAWRNAQKAYGIDKRYLGKWEIRKFAAKLKMIASILTGIPVEKFEDQEFKKTFLSSEWNQQFPIPFSGPDFTMKEEGMTVREFLQKLGTDAIRNHLHPNTWVNATMADYKEGSNWIITDCRFPNEAEAIKQKKGVMIRVERRRFEDVPVTLEQRHASETSLDNWKFDYEINNGGTMEELEVKVKGIMDEINKKDSN